MNTKENRSEKDLEARNCLPEPLRNIYDEFVYDYKFVATQFHGKPYVSYKVLAEMVKRGWRYCGEQK